jgi:hypothetical protein
MHRLLDPRPIVLAMLLATAGCASGGGASSSSTVVVPPAVPARFNPKSPASRIAPADTISGDGCQSPMVDPQDGTELRFVRAALGVADYEVPAGHYGLGANDLLRLDCNTGKVLSVVQR